VLLWTRSLKSIAGKFPTPTELLSFIPIGGGQPPGVLKGWVDRVIRAGVAYEFIEGDSGEGVPIGLLKAKAALVFNTSNTPGERERNVFGDPLEAIWKNCIFDLCGVKNFYRKMYGVIVTSTQEQRQLWLEDVRDTVNMYFPNPDKPEPKGFNLSMPKHHKKLLVWRERRCYSQNGTKIKLQELFRAMIV